jgi:hypothetical protein
MYEIRPPIKSDSLSQHVPQQDFDPVGKPIKHKAADQQVNFHFILYIKNIFTQFKIEIKEKNVILSITTFQASGEAVYVDDIPYAEGELYAGLVVSEKAHANLVDIDASQALKMEGVVEFVCYK